MQTNLRAPFLCSQRAARLMRRTERPDPALIVNIADLSGMYPWRGYALHGLSKAGIIHLTKVSAYELGPEVRVNAIAPGAILPPPNVDPEGEFWQRRGQQLPLKRTGHPDQVGADGGLPGAERFHHRGGDPGGWRRAFDRHAEIGWVCFPLETLDCAADSPL